MAPRSMIIEFKDVAVSRRSLPTWSKNNVLAMGMSRAYTPAVSKATAMTCPRPIAPDVIRNAAKNVSPARVSRDHARSVRLSLRSARTPPSSEKRMTDMAGRPLTMPTQSLESVISKTSQAMAISWTRIPVNVSPLLSQRRRKGWMLRMSKKGGLCLGSAIVTMAAP